MQSGAEVPVWERVVRLFHCSLVPWVLFNLFVLDDGEPLHRWSGYLASALVQDRIAGASWAAHLRGLLTCKRPQHRSHTPLGALMTLALVLLLGLSGWMWGLDACWGDEWLEELHEGLANALLVWLASMWRPLC